MISILMICHGNICRSPMAEFVMKDLVKKANMETDFYIASAATSSEELGNPVHRGTRAKLAEHGISTAGKVAIKLTHEDYDEYDYLIGMDDWNMKNMSRILGEDSDQKMFKLLSFANRQDDIADPWYTGDFDTTYEDVLAGCSSLLKYIQENEN